MITISYGHVFIFKWDEHFGAWIFCKLNRATYEIKVTMSQERSKLDMTFGCALYVMETCNQRSNKHNLFLLTCLHFPLFVLNSIYYLKVNMVTALTRSCVWVYYTVCPLFICKCKMKNTDICNKCLIQNNCIVRLLTVDMRLPQ